MADDGPTEVTRAEFTRELARELDMDPEELRARSRKFDLEPPWEAELVTDDDS